LNVGQTDFIDKSNMTYGLGFGWGTSNKNFTYLGLDADVDYIDMPTTDIVRITGIAKLGYRFEMPKGFGDSITPYGLAGAVGEKYENDSSISFVYGAGVNYKLNEAFGLAVNYKMAKMDYDGLDVDETTTMAVISYYY